MAALPECLCRPQEGNQLVPRANDTAVGDHPVQDLEDLFPEGGAVAVAADKILHRHVRLVDGTDQRQRQVGPFEIAVENAPRSIVFRLGDQDLVIVAGNHLAQQRMIRVEEIVGRVLDGQLHTHGRVRQ